MQVGESAERAWSVLTPRSPQRADEVRHRSTPERLEPLRRQVDRAGSPSGGVAKVLVLNKVPIADTCRGQPAFADPSSDTAAEVAIG